jgi:hypothetical protein
VACHESGYELAEDCASAGNVCDPDAPSGAQCVFERFIACDDLTPRRCEGDRLVRCVDGAMQALDCSATGDRCRMGESILVCLPD